MKVKIAPSKTALEHPIDIPQWVDEAIKEFFPDLSPHLDQRAHKNRQTQRYRLAVAIMNHYPKTIEGLNHG